VKRFIKIPKAKKEKRVRPELTYEDDIYFRLAKAKLLEDIANEKVKYVNILKLRN
jgi:hypothetical protein